MKRKKLDRSEKRVTVLAYVILTLFCILVILPCMNVIGEAVSPGDDVLGGKVYFWPTGFQTDCINYILEHTRFMNSLKNTLVVTVLGTIVSIIVTVTTAYPLSKPELKGRGWITFLYVFSMIFYGGMIPAYMVVKSLGLIDTYWGMILPFAIVQFDMFIVKSYFEGLPAEILESAEIDGAGDGKILISIVCPISKPVIATVSLLYAVTYWNDYFHAMLYTTSTNMQTLQVYLKNLISNIQSTLTEAYGSSNYTINYTSDGFVAAAVLMSIIPIVLFYPFISRYLVSGITIGSVKG